MDKKTKEISDIIELSDYYYSVLQPKKKITNLIFKRLEEKELTLKEVALQLEDTTYEELVKVTAGEEYKIDTLLKLLYFLEIRLEVRLAD